MPERKCEKFGRGAAEKHDAAAIAMSLHADKEAVNDEAEGGEKQDGKDIGHEEGLVGNVDLQGRLAGEDEVDGGQGEHVPEAAADGRFTEAA